MEKKVFLLILLVFTSLVMAGPISELYVIQWQNAGIAVIQGNSIVRSWATAASGEIAIAVTDKVRTAGHYNGYNGAEYTLNGTFTGTTFNSTNYNGTFHDGTTDGQYNYATSWSNGQIWRYDLNWANGQMLFDTDKPLLGITYDPTNDSFWSTGWGDGMVYNYNRSGQLLRSFATNDGNAYHVSLALDHADGTLWMSQSYETKTFIQFSKTGTYLSSATYSGLSGYTWGAEFSLNVPEPGTVVLAILSLAAFLAFRHSYAGR